ncbi:MAG: hydrogenase expression/formation protein HypE [Acidimicrobiales bacterium]|nr:hydrogenase expression/formation protein HypE [Acidimicrobiales bacterium]
MSAGDEQARALARIEAFRDRVPRFDDAVVTLAHGAGGKATAALVEDVFVSRLGRGPEGDPLADAAVLDPSGDERLAFTTDAFVVTPRRFPGGSVGHLAVHGTVNDLAMVGARPEALSLAVILEEGFAVAELRDLVDDIAAAADVAGVRVVTGDTKVVGRGAVDGVCLVTAGIGRIPAGRDLAARHVRPGDRLLVSGTLGDHGMAVMLARGELALEADISSDTAPLAPLVEELLRAAPGLRWLRDATRGGVATVVNELADAAGVAVVLDEVALPVRPAVAGACDLLGIDPLYVANEGKLLAVVPADEAEAALHTARTHPLGADAALIGEVRESPAGVVALATSFGSTRIVDVLVGDPLPRIC